SAAWSASPLAADARCRARLRLPPAPPESASLRSTAVATPHQSLSVHLPLGFRFGHLVGKPLEISRKAALDRDLDDLGKVVRVVGPNVFLHFLGARFERFDQEKRLVLALQLALPVIEGVHGR